MISALTTAAAAVAAMALTLIWRRPNRSLSDRLDPFTPMVARRLGSGRASITIGRAGAGLSERVSVGPDASCRPSTLAVRLAQAGREHRDPLGFRMAQSAGAALGLGIGASLGAATSTTSGQAATRALLLGALLAVWGLLHPERRLARAIDERRRQTTAEVYTVAQLLAMHLRSGRGPGEAVRHVGSSGTGPLFTELSTARRWVREGSDPTEVYRLLAERSLTPSAARLFRLLATASRTGGDLAGSLRALADDVRRHQREQLARQAVHRRATMLLPLLCLIAPVMMLFVAAAIPALILGVPSP